MAMEAAEPNYFTCTLGQAAQSKEQAGHIAHEFGTVLELINEKARRFPQSPALGFADYVSRSERASGAGFLTFGELSILSKHTACIINSSIGPSSSKNIPLKSNIGLLSTSNIDFVLVWLGLLHLGYTAVFLAPQLEPQAIRHLCVSLDVQALFVEDGQQKTAEAMEQVEIIRIPPYRDYPIQGDLPKHICGPSEPEIAYFSHTSGTSSGLPKPIPQPQSGIVKVLPYFQRENPPATFSMTPLYHGGLPDLLRSWTSSSMIWFFPEGIVPVTAPNIIKAISHARRECNVPIQYFTSVPYILQLLYEHKHGIEVLRSMDLVGVGGAPLPCAIGDGLVDAGVNLVSRMGSMECGFLMSSHRIFKQDKEWQYLRPIEDQRYLQFEPREDGLAELIVKPAWPLRIKTNRDDGSYATADLFQPHGTIPNAWRYHSRADPQLMLSNGKKFDPAPMESDILAASNLLRDVLIFGNGREYPGIILFPSSSDVPETDVLETIWPIIEKSNSQSQNHARLSKSMVLVIFISRGESALQKSSKGTILRHQAEECYKSQIEAAYSSYRAGAPILVQDTEQLFRVVDECFSRVLGRSVNPDEDLYKQNIDSMACLQIRAQILGACLPDLGDQIPLNIIYECRTLSNLIKYLDQFRSERKSANLDNPKERRKELMRNMADKYREFSFIPMSPRVTQNASGKAVVLTGATGFLGAHILHSICQEQMVDVVYLLIRAKTPEDAFQRASKALAKYGLIDINAHCKASNARPSVVCLPCDLSHGIESFSKQYLARFLAMSTTFIHTAWTVNFNLQLLSFEDQVCGTYELIQLAIKSEAKFVFISSIAAVSCSASATVPERLSDDPSEASPMGYSESKWVAEQVCVAASKAVAAMKHAADSDTLPWMSIIRVGQLCSNKSGIWNTSEAYPLMLSTESLVGCLPCLEDQPLDWLPVDIAAKAVLEIAFDGQNKVSATAALSHGDPLVFHVLNPYTTPDWRQLLSWISQDFERSNLDVVPAADWVKRLEETLTQAKRPHPSHVLLGMWKKNLVPKEPATVNETLVAKAQRYDISLAKGNASILRDFKPLDKERALNMWNWVRRNI